jgi:hypothetical protein
VSRAAAALTRTLQNRCSSSGWALQSGHEGWQRLSSPRTFDVMSFVQRPRPPAAASARSWTVSSRPIRRRDLYVLDDQAALRGHMTIFVDGRAIRDRLRLSDFVTPTKHDPCLPGFVRRLTMNVTVLVSTRKGLFWVRGEERALGHRTGRLPGRQRHSHADRSPQRPPLRGARSRPFRRQTAPFDGNGVGRGRGPGIPAEARRRRRDRHVGPSTRMEHRAHLGAAGRRWRRTGRGLVRHVAGRSVSFCRSWRQLGDDPFALGSPQAQAVDGRRCRLQYRARPSLRLKRKSGMVAHLSVHSRIPTSGW